jgi:hypothetical protein
MAQVQGLLRTSHTHQAKKGSVKVHVTRDNGKTAQAPGRIWC